MKTTFLLNLKLVVAAFLMVFLSSCSSMGNALDKVKNVDLWPFDDGTNSEQVRTYRPANSTEYQCDKGKKFFVRLLDKGETVWLITKEREIALRKVSQTEYASDNTRLSLAKDSADLTMSADTAYTNCKLVPIK